MIEREARGRRGGGSEWSTARWRRSGWPGCVAAAGAILFALPPAPAQSQEPEPAETIAVRRAPPPPPIDRTEYAGAQDRLRMLAPDFLVRDDIDGEIGALVAAFRFLAAGYPMEAARRFSELTGAEDEGVAGVAAGAVEQFLFLTGRYTEVFGEDGGESALGRALVQIGEERYEWADAPVHGTLRRMSVGTPEADVEVDGRTVPMVLDTGAGFSVLAASIAHELGVEMASGDGFEVSTSTSTPAVARLGVVRELRVGRLVAREHPVLVFPDEALTFELPGDTLVLSGIVGWTALRQGRLEMDYREGRYTLTPSDEAAPPAAPDPAATGRLSWLGYPVVRLRLEDGQVATFGLDTGSRNTSVTERIFRRAPDLTFALDSVTTGGVGGVERSETRLLHRLAIALPDVAIELTGVREESPDDTWFIEMDGVLGSDIAQGGRMIVDFPAGEFGVVLPPSVDRAEWPVPGGLGGGGSGR